MVREAETLDCEAARALLALRPTDVLEAEELASLEAHVASCEACGRESKKVSDAFALIAALDPPRRAPPPELWQRIEKELDAIPPDEVEAARAVSLVRVLLDCCYCKGSLRKGEAAYCASCLAPHHEECFRSHRRCSTYGCDETRLVRPEDASRPVLAPAEPARAPRTFAPLLFAVVGGLASAALVVSVERSARAPERAEPVALASPVAAPSAKPLPDPMPTPSPTPPRSVRVLSYPLHAAPVLTGVVLPGKVTLDFHLGAESQFVKIDRYELLDRALGSNDDWQKFAEVDGNATGFEDTRPIAPREYRIAEHASTDTENPVVVHDRTTLAREQETTTAEWSMPANPDRLWIEKGNALLAGRSFEEAIAAYSNAIGLDRRTASHWLARARARRTSQKDLALALEDCETAIQLEPRSPTGWLERSAAHLALDHYEAAQKDTDEAVNAAPEDPAPLLARAKIEATLGHFKAALRDIDRALGLDPKSLAAWSRRAQLCRSLHDLLGERDALSKTIELTPTSEEAIVRRAEVRLEQGDLDAAIADFTRAIELEPGSARAWTGRAKARTAKGDHELANADATKAISLEPSPGALIARADASLEKGDLDGAALDASAALTSPAADERARSVARAIRGLSRYQKGFHEGAVEDLEAAAIGLDRDEAKLQVVLDVLDTIAPPSTQSLVARANARLDKDDWKRASEAASAALERDPKLASAFVARGTAALEAGELGVAEADAAHALEIAPAYLDAWVLSVNIDLDRGRSPTVPGSRVVLENPGRRAVVALEDEVKAGRLRRAYRWVRAFDFLFPHASTHFDATTLEAEELWLDIVRRCIEGPVEAPLAVRALTAAMKRSAWLKTSDPEPYRSRISKKLALLRGGDE